jgi:hypothetical protein
MPTSRLPLRLIWFFVYVSSINRWILICYFNARAVFRVGLCVTVIESLDTADHRAFSLAVALGSALITGKSFV